VKNAELGPLQHAWHEFVVFVQPLFTEHYFLTVLCGFLAVMMTLSCYRFLKSISPGLVAFIFLLMFGILMLHWTITRTEPAILRPVVEWLAPFFPTAPEYAPGPNHPAVGKPAAPTGH
jgi:hypothetical protein